MSETGYWATILTMRYPASCSVIIIGGHVFLQAELKEAYKKLNDLELCIDECGLQELAGQIGECMCWAKCE